MVADHFYLSQRLVLFVPLTLLQKKEPRKMHTTHRAVVLRRRIYSRTTVVPGLPKDVRRLGGKAFLVVRALHNLVLARGTCIAWGKSNR
jgi:hypothetical protein